MADPEGIRKLSAILAADVAGYSRLMQQDDEATVASLEAYRAVFREKIQAHRGHVVDMAGDSVLAVFDSPTEAVGAASEIQDVLAERNEALPEARRMRFRIGINLGEVIERPDGTVYGDGVNVAARLESLGKPGGVTISGTVFDEVEQRSDLRFDAAGEQQVKNIAKPVRVYHWTEAKGTSVARAPAKVVAQYRRGLIVSVVAVALALLGVFTWQYSHQFDRQGAVASAATDPVLAMPTGPTIAVLPFSNMSGDPTQEYFADGLTEDIITELSRFKDVFILARNTTFQYKGQSVDVPAIGKKLGARYVLEGSVRKSADQVRITAQLIDAQSGTHVWSERYDRALSDIFVVQTEIATKIAAVIGGATGALETYARRVAQRKSPDELQAYDYVLRATLAHEWANKDEYLKAKAQLEKALALDPNYARAQREYAWLTLMGWIFRFEKTPAPPETLKRNAIRSVQLDPSDPYTHRSAAYGWYFDKQFDQFEREAKMALQLAPNDPQILSTLGFLIAIHGNWERGVKMAIKANNLNPVTAAGWYHSTLFFDYQRRGMYREALEILKQHPNQNIAENQQKYTAVYAELGDIEKAQAHWQKCIELEPGWSIYTLAKIGDLWSFEKSFGLGYMQSLEKAGYPLR
jgi:adenylate cyclase